MFAQCLHIMHDQTNNIKRTHIKFKGTWLEENNNTAGINLSRVMNHFTQVQKHNVCIFSNY